MANLQQGMAVLLSASLVFTSVGFDGCKKGNTSGEDQPPATTYAAPTPDQLYQLVAPIALFPDKLIAQVLAASTYPDQVTEAWSWVQQNSGLKGDQLLQTVDQQNWDVSIKGLTQFPDVLQQMADNLSWTSALGDAYYNAPQNVMNAVQVMRQRAFQAGNLKSTPQQNVQVQNQAPASQPAPASSGQEQQVVVVQPPPQTIIIEPAQPSVVYVPAYNPTAVYGAPVPAYPGYSTGDMVATSLISFGVGMMVGAAMSNNSCCGWGWNSWGCGWNNASVHYNNNVYISNSNTFVNRNNYYNRNNVANIDRNNIPARPTPYNANQVNRGGDFGNAPRFDQNRNQAQFRDQGAGDRGGRNQGIGDQNRRDQGIGDRNDRNQGIGNQNRRDQGVRDQGRGNQGIGDRGNNVGNNQRNQAGRNDRQPARGYGDRQDRAAGNGMGNYGQGGNARANSARGQQSLNGGGNRAGNTASTRSSGGGAADRGAGGGGGSRGGGGANRAGGGGNRGGGRNR